MRAADPTLSPCRSREEAPARRAGRTAIYAILAVVTGMNVHPGNRGKWMLEVTLGAILGVLIANAVGRLPVPVTVRILLAVFLTLAAGVWFYSHNWFLINAAAGGVTPSPTARSTTVHLHRRLAGAHRLRGRSGHHATALPRRRRRHCPRPAEWRLVRRGSGAAEDRRDAGRPDPADTEIGPAARQPGRRDPRRTGQHPAAGAPASRDITRLAPRRFSQRPSVARYTAAHPALARLADDVGGLAHLAKRAVDDDSFLSALTPPAAQLGAALDRLAEDVDDPMEV